MIKTITVNPLACPMAEARDIKQRVPVSIKSMKNDLNNIIQQLQALYNQADKTKAKMNENGSFTDVEKAEANQCYLRCERMLEAIEAAPV